MLVPKLRFKREDGTEYPEWESGTIGDYYVFKNGLNKEKAAFGKGTPIINYTDVFKNRLLTAKIIKGRVTLNEKEIENHNAMYGDVFFTRTSETLDEVGFCGALIEEIQDCVFSGFLLRGRPKDSTSIFPHFAGYYFMTNPIREEIISKSSITTRALTNGRNLSAVNVRMPHIEEQQKIADFLSTVDEVIAQSEAEVQNLEQQKKAAMQKIFSQELRFKCEDGTEYPEWEENSLKEICSFMRSGGTPKSTNKEYYNGNIPFLSISDMTKSGKYISETDKHISEEGLNNSTAWLVPKESIILSMYASYGKVCINNIELTTSQAMISLIIKDDACLEYVYQFLLHLDNIKYWKTFIKTGTQANITAEIVKNVVVFIPCLEEQQKIADFLSAYDEAISYAKQEFEHWKQLKKGLLQQMFV